MRLIRKRSAKAFQPFPISPTSLRREVANRHIQQRAFRRIAPVASCEAKIILQHTPRYVNFRLSSPDGLFRCDSGPYAPAASAAPGNSDNSLFVRFSFILCSSKFIDLCFAVYVKMFC